MNDRGHKDSRSALESLLSGLNRDQLQSLLLKLSEQEPSLIQAIERQVALLRTSQTTTPSLQTSARPPVAVDTKAARRQVRSIIHSLDRIDSLDQLGARLFIATCQQDNQFVNDEVGCD